MAKFEKFYTPYARFSDAWNHLREWDENPSVVRQKGDYVLFLNVRLSAKWINWRIFESFEAVTRYISTYNVFEEHIFTNLAHFRTRYTAGQVRQLYRLVTGEAMKDVVDLHNVGSNHPPMDEHQIMWNYFQNGKVVQIKGRPITSKSHQRLYIIDLLKLSDKSLTAKALHLTKQLELIVRFLVMDQRTSYTIDDLRIFANNLPKRGLVTKQDPFKVLQFYMPQLHDAGFMEYPRKEVEVSAKIDDYDYGDDENDD